MRRIAVTALLAGLVVLVMAGAALAATPSEIYDDFAADGDLDRAYTKGELDAVLTDATLAQYGDPDVLGDLKRHIRRTPSVSGAVTTRSSFPFTGFEAGMAVVVAALMVGGGIAFRRSAR